MPSTGGRPIGGADEPTPTNDAEAWPPLSRAGSLTVGVIDTGIVLDGRRRPPAWFGDHVSYCPEDDVDEVIFPAGGRLPSEGHGTFVAGLVLREAPSARVRAWGVLAKVRVPFTRDETSDETTERDDHAVAIALAALALNPAVQVVNLSFAGTVFEQRKELPVLEEAVAKFHTARPNVAIVAAAGNRSTEDVVFPAGFEHVLSVGALDTHELAPDGNPPVAHFSNHGEWVSVYAAGVDVRGPLPQADGSQWARWSGTSFASALVAGRIAQVAIEQGISGAQAQNEVVTGATILADGRLWVRGVDDQLL